MMYLADMGLLLCFVLLLLFGLYMHLVVSNKCKSEKTEVLVTSFFLFIFILRGMSIDGTDLAR